MLVAPPPSCRCETLLDLRRASLSLALVLAACSPSVVVSSPVNFRQPFCSLEIVDSGLSGALGDSSGSALAAVTHDAGLFFGNPPDTRRVEVVSGAPESTSGGRVFFQPIHWETGIFVGLNGELMVPIGGGFADPLGSAGERVGASLLGVDLLEHLDDTAARVGFGLIGPGQELLIGAPGGGAQGIGGRVIWFYKAYDPGPEPWSSPQLHRWEYGGWFAAPDMPVNAGFGAALAAPRTAMGQQVPFVAVGAPGGAGRVVIIEPDPTWTTGMGPATADPLGGGTLSVLHASAIAGGSTPPGFGQTLLVEDLNADGFPDLVIGAVATGHAGRVFVIPGAPTGLDIAARFEVRAEVGFLSSDAEFGRALAAGNLHHPDGPPTLVIGAPMTAPSGGVCQIHFVDGFPTPNPMNPPLEFADCAYSPFTTDEGFSAAQRFGQSLAIADFIRQDSMGQSGTPAARLHELAVGAPGLEPSAPYVIPSTLDVVPYEVASSSLPGTVTIFRSWPTRGALIDLEIPHMPALEEDGEVLIGHSRPPFVSHYLHQFQSTIPQPDQGFATAMVAADLAPVTGWPDLVIGAPGTDSDRGQIEVTRTTRSMNGWVEPVAGRYGVLDSMGVPGEAIVLHSPDGYRIALTDFRLGFVRSGGTPCEHAALEDPLTGLTSPIPFERHEALWHPPKVTTDLEVTFTDEDGNDALRFTVDVTHDGNAETLTLAIRQPRVREAGMWVNPFAPHSCVGKDEHGNDFLLEDRVVLTCEL